jgi:hypothetical protein
MSAELPRLELIPNRLSLQVRPEGAGTLHLDGASLDLDTEALLHVAREFTNVVAMHHAEEEVDPESSVRLAMQLVILQIERDPESEAEDDQPEEGEVYCWIKEQSRQNAIHVAVGWVNESEWIITNVNEHRTVDRSEFEDTPLLPYYDQALTDDEVFVYIFPESDSDDEDKN